MQKRKQGRIIPNGVSLEKHENDVVVVFTNLGYDVELIRYGHTKGQKTADAIIDGLKWEFKVPRGNTTKSIERIMKKAAHQSENIVLDLQFVKIPEDLTIRKIEFEFHQRKSIKRIKVILKSKKIIDIQ